MIDFLLYVDWIKRARVVENFASKLPKKIPSKSSCPYGLCRPKKKEEKQPIWYQDCAWGQCQYLNGQGNASDLPTFADINCYSDLRLHVFESRMNAPYITYTALCNEYFPLYPYKHAEKSMQEAKNQKIYSYKHCNKYFQ